ncbi:MAG TPA: hypothetical protein VH333_10590 [Pseudonocardiaceae bacterium]|jgi:hypothetical protein|nr:hypothetical protein [Pseudonocardiaceae bacterium]
MRDEQRVAVSRVGPHPIDAVSYFTWVTNINDRPDPVVFAVSSGAVPSGEERCHG